MDITANEPESWRVGDLPGQHEIGLFVDDPIPLTFANGDDVPWKGTKATVTLRGGAANAAPLPIKIIVIDVSDLKFLCSINFQGHKDIGYYEIKISQVQALEDFTYTTLSGDMGDENHAGTTDLIIRNI